MLVLLAIGIAMVVILRKAIKRAMGERREAKAKGHRSERDPGAPSSRAERFATSRGRNGLGLDRLTSRIA